MESLGGRTAVAAMAAIICAMVLLMPLAYAQNSPQDYLDAHNTVREEVGVEPLVWDDVVAAYAQNYADQRVGDCSLIHSGGEYGENIFWGSSTDFTAADAVNLWVSERDDYDYPSNSCAPDKACGHYTQVVWRNSLRLGCARAECNDGGLFITCNYDPPGNYEGEWPFEQLKLPRNATMHALAS